MTVIEHLVTNCLLYAPPPKIRFIKGSHKNYAMIPPNQLKKNPLSMKALTSLNMNIDEYEKLWNECLLPSPDLATKIEPAAIDHIESHLIDYISIIHRLGNANDLIARKILQPALLTGKIGVNFGSQTFSLAPDHHNHFETDDDVMKQLHKICMRATSNESPKNLIQFDEKQNSMSSYTLSSGLSSNQTNPIDTQQPVTQSTEESSFIINLDEVLLSFI